MNTGLCAHPDFEYVKILDSITQQAGEGGQHLQENVFDCWFEPGSMPYASAHYPFENVEQFEKFFPGDFIAKDP
jgi:isoleucyl-tRNA synthetase